MTDPREIPVALFLFNRPGPTARVFEAIRAARPRTLLVVADGPRPTVAGEAELCRRARAAVDRVDWDCDVRTNFSAENLGCGRRMATGIGWVFEQCESAIFLEDDCIPSSSFFPFCAELLDRYRDDARIFAVNGTAYGTEDTTTSYRFSRYFLGWGWASWRRSWDAFDFDLRDWPRLRDAFWLDALFSEEPGAAYWRTIFDAVHRGAIDSWDYQMLFASWQRDALSLHPSRNLVDNVGFGRGATNTKKRPPHYGKSRDLSFPLVHPPEVRRDARRDRWLQENIFAAPPRWRTFFRRSLPGVRLRG